MFEEEETSSPNEDEATIDGGGTGPPSDPIDEDERIEGADVPSTAFAAFDGPAESSTSNAIAADRFFFGPFDSDALSTVFETFDDPTEPSTSTPTVDFFFFGPFVSYPGLPPLHFDLSFAHHEQVTESFAEPSSKIGGPKHIRSFFMQESH